MIFYRSWHKPLVLSFDLDDTLYDNQPIIDFAEKYTAKLLGIAFLGGKRLFEQDIVQVKKDLFAENPLLINDVTKTRYLVFKKLLRDFGYHDKAQDVIVQKMMECFLHVRSNRVQIQKKVIDILYTLKKRYPLIAISNGNMDVKQTSLAGIFEKVYNPNVNVFAKPSADLFNQAIKDYHIAPNMLCHIGDSGYTDILGGLNAGSQTVLVTSFRVDSYLLLPHVEVKDIEELLTLFTS